jgi:ABC-type sugar transport system substrate-binding protein
MIGRFAMRSIVRTTRYVLIVTFTVVLFAFFVGPSFAEGPIFKITPKGSKKITIGVIDPNAGIEAAAQFNKKHSAEAAKRGWNVRFVDLKDNIPQGVTQMENMISAGYDAIILHWMPLKVIDKQIKMAFDKGIPVICLICQGARTPGVLADIGWMEAAHGGMLAEYLGNSLQAGDKVVTITVPMLEKHAIQLGGFKGVADVYKLNIVQNLQFQFSGDPVQWAYEQTSNVLIADAKKEIKGIYVSNDSLGIPAARAVHDRGRDDIVFVMSDDSPMVYHEMPKLPALKAVAAMAIHEQQLNALAFSILDKAFKGESVVSQKWYPTLGSLLTRDKLPPPGYSYDASGGYKTRKPDFAVK